MSAPAPGNRVSAAAVVAAQLTDRGLLVANRTDLPIRVEVEICTGPPDFDQGSESGEVSTKDSTLQPSPNDVDNPVLERVRLTLNPRDEGLIPRENLGSAAAWPFPTAVTRNWSHEVATVYEGSDLTLGTVRAVFLDQDGRQIGATERAGGLGLGVFLTAADINAVLK